MTQRQPIGRQLPPAQPEPKTAPRLLRATVKQIEALQLRMAGATYTEIAEQVGYKHRGGAFNAVKAALRKFGAPPTEEMQQLEAARLDRLQIPFWTAAVAGNVKALDRVLGIMKRRADLLGLDAAKKVDVRVALAVLTETLDHLSLPRAQAVIVLLTEDSDRIDEAVELLTEGQVR